MITINPSATSARITSAITEAVREISTCGCGIPMIDDEGRPRPSKIIINAATEIRGTKNIISEKAVMEMIMAKVASKRKAQMEAEAVGKKFPLRDWGVVVRYLKPLHVLEEVPVVYGFALAIGVAS